MVGSRLLRICVIDTHKWQWSHITAATAVVTHEDSTLHLNYKVSTAVFLLSYCFVLSVTSPGGGTTPFCFYFYVHFFFFFFVSFVLFSVIARFNVKNTHTLSTLLTALQCSISVSWLCDHRAGISLGRRIGTDTVCAGCRWVERTV